MQQMSERTEPPDLQVEPNLGVPHEPQQAKALLRHRIAELSSTLRTQAAGG